MRRFVNPTTKTTFVVTLIGVVAMEASDLRTRNVPRGESRDRATGAAIGAALGAATAIATVSVLRSSRHMPIGTRRTRFVGGAIIAWLGIALNRWSKYHLGRRYHPLVVVQDDHDVVTSGPYRVIRHPMYAGSLLICVGIGLLTDTRAGLAVWMLAPPTALARRILVEEQALAQGLGEAYSNFAGKRRRIIPGLW